MTRDRWRYQLALNAALRIMESDTTKEWTEQSPGARALHVRGLASEFFQWLPDDYGETEHEAPPMSRLMDVTDDIDIQREAALADQGGRQ